MTSGGLYMLQISSSVLKTLFAGCSKSYSFFVFVVVSFNVLNCLNLVERLEQVIAVRLLSATTPMRLFQQASD